MKTTPIKFIGQASPEDIAKWKKENPLGIYQILSDGHVGYFKNPSIDDANCATSKASTEAAYDMFKELGNITFLGGSREVLENDTKFLRTSTLLKKKLEGAEAELLDL